MGKLGFAGKNQKSGGLLRSSLKLKPQQSSYKGMIDTPASAPWHDTEMTGIKQQHISVPGTELLIDQDNSHAIQQYQHVAHGDSRLLLVPQPSLTDPNDPLLWPRWKKWAVFGNSLFFAFNGGVTGPMMAAGVYLSRSPKKQVQIG
jgi:hypothetical protein